MSLQRLDWRWQQLLLLSLTMLIAMCGLLQTAAGQGSYGSHAGQAAVTPWECSTSTYQATSGSAGSTANNYASSRRVVVWESRTGPLGRTRWVKRYRQQPVVSRPLVQRHSRAIVAPPARFERRAVPIAQPPEPPTCTSQGCSVSTVRESPAALPAQPPAPPSRGEPASPESRGKGEDTVVSLAGFPACPPGPFPSPPPKGLAAAR